MDIMQLVDEIEALISKSFRIPFTSNILVNEDELFDILDQMRVTIPREVKEAKRIEAERERILARAQEEANRVLDLAKEKMMKAVDDHEIVEAARDHGELLVEQAESLSLQLRHDSNQYVIDHLSSLEEQLLKLLTTVRNGLQQVEVNQPRGK